MDRVDKKNRAVLLRKKGLSYSEIQEALGDIPKSTLSNWIGNLSLNKTQLERLKKKSLAKGQVGRLKGAHANRQIAQRRVEEIQKGAEKEFLKLSQNRLFLIGVALYWAEGNQKTKRFQFTNSNPEMIRVMMRWLKDICNVEDSEIKYRLFIHDIYSNERCEEFWADIVGEPLSKFLKTIYKSNSHKTKKNPNYKGCLKIDVKGSELYWKVQKWQKMLSNLPSW